MSRWALGNSHFLNKMIHHEETQILNKAEFSENVMEKGKWFGTSIHKNVHSRV